MRLWQYYLQTGLYGCSSRKRGVIDAHGELCSEQRRTSPKSVFCGGSCSKTFGGRCQHRASLDAVPPMLASDMFRPTFFRPAAQITSPANISIFVGTSVSATLARAMAAAVALSGPVAAAGTGASRGPGSQASQCRLPLAAAGRPPLVRVMHGPHISHHYMHPHFQKQL